MGVVFDVFGLGLADEGTVADAFVTGEPVAADCAADEGPARVGAESEDAGWEDAVDGDGATDGAGREDAGRGEVAEEDGGSEDAANGDAASEAAGRGDAGYGDGANEASGSEDAGRGGVADGDRASEDVGCGDAFNNDAAVPSTDGRVADSAVAGGRFAGCAVAGEGRQSETIGTGPAQSPLAAIRPLKSRIFWMSCSVRFAAAASSADISTAGRRIRAAGCALENATKSGLVRDSSASSGSAVDRADGCDVIEVW